MPSSSLSLEEAGDEYGDLPTIVTSLSKKWKDAKQSSLNEDLISRDRFASNVEMRKKIQKQQSLPDDGSGTEHPKTEKTLRESLMLAITRTKKFETLRSSLFMWKSGEQNDTVPENQRQSNLGRAKSEDNQASRIEGPESCEKQDEPDAVKQPTEPKPNMTQRQGSGSQGSSFRSGIVRIFQSWRSESLESSNKGGSFTRKRGVSITPIDIRGGRDGNPFGLGEAANRRNIFQKRRGGSSPLSPKQLDALSKEGVENLSPTFRRGYMEGTEIMLYSASATDQFTMNKERKLSRSEASDSSSKEGSITSDTSMDSEDSCVSVIFVPHPERKVKEKKYECTNAYRPQQNSYLGCTYFSVSILEHTCLFSV